MMAENMVIKKEVPSTIFILTHSFFALVCYQYYFLNEIFHAAINIRGCPLFVAEEN